MRGAGAVAAAVGLLWLAGGCSSSGTPAGTHWTYRWKTLGQQQGADGGPRPPYPAAAPGTAATIEFHASPGWRFVTYFHRAGHPCAPAYGARATSTSDGVWTVPTAGPAGTWLVEMRGRGPEGDVATTFRWRTTGAGHGCHVPPGPACEGR